jgi:hypothetical protein
VTRAEFIVIFPEFGPTDPDVVEAHLTAAADFTSDLWKGPQRPLALALRAADSIAVSPLGRRAGLSDPEEGSSTYARRLLAMQQARACGTYLYGE